VARAGQDTAFGLVGALAVHGLLLIALVLNLDWLSEDPPAVQAELWSSLPPERMPVSQAQSPAPAPPPPVKAEPEPAPKSDAEIAIERRKQEQEKRRQAEQRREAEQKKESQRREAEQKKAAQSKEAQKREAARLERERAEELKRLGLDPKAKPMDKGKDASTKAGVASGAATGERSGREAEWADRVKGILESRVRYRGSNTSDLELEILLLPTGQLQSVRVLIASNTPAYDQAVLEAVRGMTFPKPPEGVRALTIKMRHRADGR